MSARQLELFRSPRPLVERLGEDLFRRVPRCPGVYIMTGACGRVLYVGQSSNLRSRLTSYKNARPGLVAAKTIRLVNAVHSIVWETCESPDVAQLRENELLRRHQPRFNSVNTYPRGYWFVWLRYEPQTLELGRGHELTRRGKVFGAFKGGVVPAFAAGLRLIWAGLYQPASLCRCPIQLSRNRPPPSYAFELPTALPASECGRLIQGLEEFFGGVSCSLPDHLAALWTPGNPFERASQAADLETLRNFYAAGPKIIREMILSGAVNEDVVPQETLDDLLVIRKNAKTA